MLVVLTLKNRSNQPDCLQLNWSSGSVRLQHIYTVSSSHCYVCCECLKLSVRWREDCRIWSHSLCSVGFLFILLHEPLGCTFHFSSVCGENITASSKKQGQVLYYFSVCVSLLLVYMYSGAKKYLVSHQLCKFSHKFSFKWENLHNWWLTKYFFAPLYMSMLCSYFSWQVK